MTNRLQIRRGTAAAWAAANPILASGEPALETDTGKRKLGDGATVWNSLAYDVRTADVTAAQSAAVATAAADATTKVATTIPYPAAYIDPRAHTDGAITALTRGTFVSSFGNSPLVIASGAIVHTPSQATNTAGYVQAQLAGNVARVGALIEFSPTATGTVAIALPLAAWASGSLTNAGVHATVTPTQVSLARYESAAETNKLSVPITGIVGNRHTVEVTVDYRLNRVSMFFDGQRVIDRVDAAATALISTFAVWELFESNGSSDVPATILSTWAYPESRVPATNPSVNATRPALPAPQYVNYNTTATWAIGTSYASLNALAELSVVVPPSGKVLTSVSCYLTSGTAATYMRPALGGTTGTPIRVAESGFIGLVTVQQVVTGTVGSTLTLAWQASCASGAPSVKVGGSSGGISVVAVPLPE